MKPMGPKKTNIKIHSSVFSGERLSFISTKNTIDKFIIKKEIIIKFKYCILISLKLNKKSNDIN